MKKSIGRRIGETAAAVSVSAGIILGGIFNSPADLLKNDDKALPVPPPAVIEVVNPDTDPGDDGDGSENETSEKKKNLKERIRAFVLRIPVAVRAVIALPLWCIGWIITGGLSLLWKTVLSPVMGTVVKWLCLALVLFGIVWAVLKTVFPDMKLKEIFSKSRILTVLIGIAAGLLSDLIMQAADCEGKLILLVRGIITLVTLCAAIVPIVMKRAFARRKNNPQEA